MLKNDLRAIQGGIKELLGVSGSMLSVPSWKFPSKQAAEVDIHVHPKFLGVDDKSLKNAKNV